MQKHVVLAGILSFALISALVKRHCDYCPAATPVESVATIEPAKHCHAACSDAVIAERMEQVVYNVADLVVPTPDSPMPADDQEEAPRPMQFSEPERASKPREVVTAEVEKLINVICESVDPESWRTGGGLGSVQYLPIGMALVINQTAKNHEQIRSLLDSLRRTQEGQVAIEVRLLCLSRAAAERLGLDEPHGPERGVLAVSYLGDQAVRSLMQDVMTDRHNSAFLMAPKITVFNGQRASVSNFEAYHDAGAITPPLRAGYGFEVCPVVTEDRRSVRLNFALELQHVNVQFQPPHSYSLNVRRTFQVTDGQTALMPCGWVKEASPSACPDIMRGIPGIDWLVSQLGEEMCDRYTIVLVTPRIIVNEGEETRLSEPRP